MLPNHTGGAGAVSSSGMGGVPGAFNFLAAGGSRGTSSAATTSAVVCSKEWRQPSDSAIWHDWLGSESPGGRSASNIKAAVFPVAQKRQNKR